MNALLQKRYLSYDLQCDFARGQQTKMIAGSMNTFDIRVSPKIRTTHSLEKGLHVSKKQLTAQRLFGKKQMSAIRFLILVMLHTTLCI